MTINTLAEYGQFRIYPKNCHSTTDALAAVTSTNFNSIFKIKIVAVLWSSWFWIFLPNLNRWVKVTSVDCHISLFTSRKKSLCFFLRTFWCLARKKTEEKCCFFFLTTIKLFSKGWKRDSIQQLVWEEDLMTLFAQESSNEL